MEYIKKVGLLLFSILLSAVNTNAQDQKTRNDSVAHAIKIKSLRSQKESLEKQIAAEDKKRNAVVSGVSPETLESMNIRQDSICLQLRSALIDVELELKEIDADKFKSKISRHYNVMKKTMKDSVAIEQLKQTKSLKAVKQLRKNKASKK